MIKNNKKFLIIGLGSMGKRRIRNLRANGEYQIIGYDILPERMKEAKKKYGIEIIDDIKKITVKDFDCMIISTPPDLHGDYIRLALKFKKHFFVEHPVIDDGYKEIFNNKNKKIIKAPSCTLRYYKPIKMLKEFLEKGKIGKILAFQYHMGQYLPDWHPWEDYQNVYFSKKNSGACREMFPFELTWINWLVKSDVEKVGGFVGKVSNLKMNADDIFLANLKYKNGVLGNIIIDVVSRKPFRTLRVLGNEGVLEWERFDSIIKIYNAKTKKTVITKIPKGHPHTGYLNEEEMYDDEIKAFLNAVYGKKKYTHTFVESHILLKVLYALEKSNGTNRLISL